MSETDGARSSDADGAGDHARDGLSHLQNAAKEVIAAARALLDAAEDLVEDPAAMGQLGDALTTIAKLASTAIGGVPRPGSRPEPHDDSDTGESRVQRIRVS
ncbi:MAG: hypothetical protein ABIV94_05450 [Acidimicrobiales bacterium]